MASAMEHPVQGRTIEGHRRTAAMHRTYSWYALFPFVLIAGCSSPPDNKPVIVPANVQPVAKTSVRMEPFSGLIGGRWRMTALAGTVMHDTWHWGPERNSIRKMTAGTASSGEPWHGISVYFWHPGRKEVRTFGVSPFARGVSEGTFTFDGEKANGLVDMHQTIGHRVFGRRWTFEGPDAYHDELLDKVPEGFSLQNEWRRFRVGAATEDELAAERTVAAAAKPSEFIKPIERLLGHAWEGKAVPGVVGRSPAATLRTRTTFEYVPDADAIYGRVQTLDPDGAPSHAMDLYLYHHTGAGVLRCLAIANSGDGEGVVYEGDITPEDNGRSLRIDLRAHRSSGGSTIEARIDFEPPGGARVRAWSTEGKVRTLIFDHVQSEAKK
ncbi:MAG: hypothetical protein HEQ23_09750 [Tepidisphaera sp.]